MLIIISPAKSLDMSQIESSFPSTENEFLKKSKILISSLKNYTSEELSKMMNISDKLARLNYQRFQDWRLPITNENGKQALYAFTGDVYTGIDAHSLSEEDILYAQEHLRILSGLYGVLRPLDLISAYRLEMGTKLQTKSGYTLYEFWGNLITSAVQNALNNQKDGILVNLASNEYFKSIDKKRIKARIITPEFKDYKNGTYKIISFFAKKARGWMTRFIIENKIEDPEKLKLFDIGGYFYNDELSKPDNPVFTR